MASRSSLLIWLLLLATISVTAVATMWMLDEGLQSETTATVYLGLTLSELTVLCAAMARSRRDFRVAWVLPFLLALFAATLMAVAHGFPDDSPPQPVNAWTVSPNGTLQQQRMTPETPEGLARWEPLPSFAALFWLHVASILLVLWMLRPTALFAKFSDKPPGSRWQFSLMHLLLLMTCVAVLSTTLPRAERLTQRVEDIVSVATLPIANGLLFVAVLWATMSKNHFTARLSLCMSSAIIIAAVCGMAEFAFADEINIFVYALLQALVMWAWFELMRPNAQDVVPVADKV